MIAAVDVALRRLRLKQVQMRGTTPVTGEQECVFVRVLSDSGEIGHGEASAWAVFSEQSPKAMAAVLTELLAPAVHGRSEFDRFGLQRAMDAAVPGNDVAKAALDMAVLDLVGRSLGQPAANVLGGDLERRFQLSYSVSIPDPGEVGRVVRERLDAGYRIFKLKVGALDVDTDLARLRELRATAPAAILRLDYNGRGDERGLRAMLAPARLAGVDFVEQPFPAGHLDRLERLRSWFDVPISLDESVTTVASLDGVLRRGLCDVVSVKLGRAGGATQLVDMTRLAGRYGVGVYCGGFNETRLGVTAAMHAFSTAGPLLPGSDFYFPFEVIDDGEIAGGPRREGDELSLGRAAGLGAELPEHWFKEAVA
jgi:muconate cycloisomerase